MAKISKSVAKERIEQLRRELEEHNRNYYVLSTPVISDFEYDMLMMELQGLEARFPEFASEESPTRKVGSDLTEISEGFAQVEHRYPMPQRVSHHTDHHPVTRFGYISARLSFLRK